MSEPKRRMIRRPAPTRRVSMRPKPVKFQAPEPVETVEVVTPTVEDVPETNHDELFQSPDEPEAELTQDETEVAEPTTSPFLDVVQTDTEAEFLTTESTETNEPNGEVVSIPAARDEKVLEALSGTGDAGLSKSDVTAKVVSSNLFPTDNPESSVYQSLTRLKNSGRIERIGPPRNAMWRTV